MPAFIAWLRGQRGQPIPQLWHTLETCEPYYRVGNKEQRISHGAAHEQFIEKHQMKPGEERLPLTELAIRYPCLTTTTRTDKPSRGNLMVLDASIEQLINLLSNELFVRDLIAHIKGGLIEELARLRKSRNRPNQTNKQKIGGTEVAATPK